MQDGIDSKIDIQFGPVQVIGPRALNVKNACHGRLAEPGELVEGQKHFAIPKEQPDTVRGDPGDFNQGSVVATRRGFRSDSWTDLTLTSPATSMSARHEALRVFRRSAGDVEAGAGEPGAVLCTRPRAVRAAFHGNPLSRPLPTPGASPALRPAREPGRRRARERVRDPSPLRAPAGTRTLSAAPARTRRTPPATWSSA